MPELSLYDEIYFRLSQIEEFKNLSMDRQGEICINVKKLIEGFLLTRMDKKTRQVLERVAEGVWNSKGGTVDELFHITQCVFCCVSPESKHSDWCPVKLAKEVLEK